MLNTTWWGWEVGIQTFKTAELCCLFVASGSTYFPAKKCHPPKKPPSQPSMVGGWPPSMIFRSKMDPRLASSLTQEAWRQGTMNWTDGRDVNRTLSEIWRSYRGVVPKKSNPVHFGHNTNIIVAQDFFFFQKQGLVCYHEFLRWFLLLQNAKLEKGLKQWLAWRGKWRWRKPSKAPLVFCSFEKAGGLWRKVPLPKQKESQDFFDFLNDLKHAKICCFRNKL